MSLVTFPSDHAQGHYIPLLKESVVFAGPEVNVPINQRGLKR